MRKRLDDIFSILMLLAAGTVVVAGTFCLTRSIERAGAEPPIAPVAQAHLELPAADLVPDPDPEQVPDLQLTCNPDIPLTAELQAVLYEACMESGVPVELALGVIQVESRFDVDAVSTEGCYGLMQLNTKYFPADLPPADNLRAGIAWLACLLERYEDTAAALTSYNAGYDTGSRGYADAVLAAAEDWSD